MEETAVDASAHEEPELLTHSSASCAAACLRRYWFRYELGLVPIEDREALLFGTLFHRAQELTDRGVAVEDIAQDLRARAPDLFFAERVLRLFTAHRWYYEDKGLEVVEVERVFSLPIRNPATGRPTPKWRNAGKRDKVVRLPDGRLAYYEYKTSTENIAPGSDYWARLRLDGQSSRYVLAARAEGLDIRTIIYDVSLRPALKPLKATPPESRRFTKDGRLDARQRLIDESVDEYGDRIHASIQENPARYFQRHEVTRTDDDLAEFEQELWDTQRNLSEVRRHGRWYRNTNACLVPYRCDYLSACADRFPAGARESGFPVPPGFKWADSKHPELDAPVE